MSVVLSFGDRGEWVSDLQELLNILGYPVEIDGIFGTETEAAVMQFQKKHKDHTGKPLEVNGILGPEVWWALTHAEVKEPKRMIALFQNSIPESTGIMTAFSN
jgi:peptidoglycan hydrolase-like protein with peptidoglycan-binding domain